MVQIIPLTEGIINPGSLRLKGNMAVTVNGTVVAATVGPIDSDAAIRIRPSIVPPLTAELATSWISDRNRSMRFGYWLSVPWDGEGAVCHGLWWANW